MRVLQLALLVSALAQQPAPQVRVLLVDGSNGQPVPRVRYTVTGAGMIDPLTGSGDPQGNVALSDLPAGKYQLTIDKAAYFQEKVDFNVGSAPVELPSIVMTAKREISGTVRWQDGEPAARAQIRVVQVRGGKAPVGSAAQLANVNDRGEFVVTNLRPGRYVLIATPPTFIGGIDANGTFAGGGVPRIGLPVFYPGVSAPDARAAIDLRGTSNIQNVQIVFEEKQGTIVEGQVTPSASAALGTDVLVTLAIPNMYVTGVRTRVGDPFRIGPVPGGFYVMEAQSQGTQPSRALLALTVGGNTLKGVTISIPPPTFLTGRLEIDNPAVRLSGTVRIQSDRLQGTQSSPVNEMGDFRIPFVVSGETYGMTVALPAGFPGYVASVSQNGQEKDFSPFKISAVVDPIQVVVKTDGGTIEGKTAPQAFVVLAPKDRRLEQNFRTAIAGNDGTFKLPPIAPGDYDLLALERNEDDDYLDEVFLRGFEEKFVAVSVAPRSTRSVELPVQRIPRR